VTLFGNGVFADDQVRKKSLEWVIWMQRQVSTPGECHSKMLCQVWWCMTVVSGLRRPRQEDLEFEASLGHNNTKQKDIGRDCG
jgi:hypothetical protein